MGVGAVAGALSAFSLQATCVEPCWPLLNAVQ